MFEQLFVIGSLNWISFSNGFVFGHVACVVASLQKNDEGIDLSEQQTSLIASILASTCFIGFGLAAAVTDKLGRRWAFILFSIPTMVNFIILYHARLMYQFMLSRIMAGISVGALLSLNIFVTSEYTSPISRQFFLNMITTAAPAIGTGLAHAIGIVFHYRTVALFGIFTTGLGILLPYFWIESPHWLASKGKFEESTIAFRTLHGNTMASERELSLLIKMETNKLARANETNCEPTLKRLLVACKRIYFWRLILLSFFIHVYFAAAGKLLFSVLATVILEEITGTSDVLLFTILIDVFIVFGSCTSCVLIRKTSMRVILFSTSFAANAMLVLFSICYYFKNGDIYFNWINVVLLALYFITINTGPYPVLEAISSEMFPLELKIYVFFFSGVIDAVAVTLTIVLLPHIVSSIGYHGLFLINTTIMFISVGYMWLMLPETKGKTLQEIEAYFKTNNFDVDEVLSKEQMKALI